MNAYLYLLPERGYFAGNKCFTKDGNAISLGMTSEVDKSDAPGTPITYIRPRPFKISWLTEKQLNLRHPNMQALSGEEAIKKLLSRGRTLQEIKSHKKKYGVAIILDEDIAAYESKHVPRLVSVDDDDKKEASKPSQSKKSTEEQRQSQRKTNKARL